MRKYAQICANMRKNGPKYAQICQMDKNFKICAKYTQICANMRCLNMRNGNMDRNGATPHPPPPKRVVPLTCDKIWGEVKKYQKQCPKWRPQKWSLKPQRVLFNKNVHHSGVSCRIYKKISKNLKPPKRSYGRRISRHSEFVGHRGCKSSAAGDNKYLHFALKNDFLSQYSDKMHFLAKFVHKMFSSPLFASLTWKTDFFWGGGSLVCILMKEV